jgi:hypothetical protein
MTETKTDADSDLERYRHHLDQFDMTDEQKLELVNAIRLIAESVIDEHFRLKQRPPGE